MASIATPQFVQVPPENLIVPAPALSKVEPRVVPEIRYTSVLFAVQTVCPVKEFEAHEFDHARCRDQRRRNAAALHVSTTLTPLVPKNQSPLGN